jgi:hypothetical protein
MKFFFDIPIYRVARSKYESGQRSFVQREMSADGDSNVQERYRHDPTYKKFMERHFSENYGGCWRFNEIIGFIRLNFFSTQIRGEYWRVTAKRITRTRRKVFTYFGHNVTTEEEIPPRSTNRKIYSLIQKYLVRAQNERHLKKFYIDKSVFENVGPYIDWNALIKLNNLRT